MFALLFIQGGAKAGLQLFLLKRIPYLINNNTRINSVLHTHNYKPTFASPCINELPFENFQGSLVGQRPICRVADGKERKIGRKFKRQNHSEWYLMLWSLSRVFENELWYYFNITSWFSIHWLRYTPKRQHPHRPLGTRTVASSSYTDCLLQIPPLMGCTFVLYFDLPWVN